MNLNVITKVILLGYVLLQFSLEGDVTFVALTLLLLIIALQVVKEKYYDSIIISIVTLILVSISTYMEPRFAILFAILLYDFTKKKIYYGLVITGLIFLYFTVNTSPFYLYLLMMILYGLLAYVIQLGGEKERRFTQTLDNERRLRYELEQAKAQLLHSSREIAAIAEVKERNRIAREIHDSIGHSIAGILIQLQAAHKLYQKDDDRAQEVLQRSIDGLAEAVEMLRDTVHNIKPQQNLGVGYIQNIIDQYQFAPIAFRTSGDFNKIPANHLEILSATIKEALTNTARYSKATNVEIAIDVNGKYTRLYIKDNGIGSKQIKEGLGISGMRERVRNIGGSISISSDEGFLIVCLLPQEEGSGIFASADRR